MQVEEEKGISKRMGSKEECIWQPVLKKWVNSLTKW